MVLGTSSHAGKTTVAAALCRCLARKGHRVAPFKAQNMSNNSWVTPEGAEIGRAQAMQARACGIEPHADMNPLLLKPSGGNVVQVVALGKVLGSFSGREYYRRKEEMRSLVHAAYDRLAQRFDVVVLEGAGSPAEINLRAEDLVNGSMAEHAGARCILVADIERGGVFASILGTISLLEERHRKLLAGVIINKFRGDASLLDSGIREIEALTGVPVLGVLPWLENVDLEEEDSLGLRGSETTGPALIDIAVVRFPHISNFTDFQPFLDRKGVGLRYFDNPKDIGNPDFLILPGSKNVRLDADFLRQTNLDRVLLAAEARRIPILGICGGFQILGRVIRDPHGMEGTGLDGMGLEKNGVKQNDSAETKGLGLLPIETSLEREKELCRVEAENLALPFLAEGDFCDGYEIHMGRSAPIEADDADRPLLRMVRKNGVPQMESGGFISVSGLVFGCYLHGMFDRREVREALYRWLCARKGLDWREDGTHPDGMANPARNQVRNRERDGTDLAASDPIDRIADWLETRLDAVSLLPPPTPLTMP